MKIKFKFEVDTSKDKENEEKKQSLSEVKEKVENVINSTAEKAEPVLKEAKGRAKGFFDKMVDLAEKTAERIEDYVDQKLAEEKEVGPDDITEEFFESDDEEVIDSEEALEEETKAEETVEEETETEEAVEEEPGVEEVVEEEMDVEDTFQMDVKPKKKVNTISLEEFLDEIVGFKTTDEEIDISFETEGFLWAIKYFTSDISKAAFEAAVNLPKITYTSVINAIERDFPEMTTGEIRNQLQADYKNWVNVRYPVVKEKCPNSNCITMMKYWAKKYKTF